MDFINFDELASWLGYLLTFTFVWGTIGVNYYILHIALKEYSEKGGVVIHIFVYNLFLLFTLPS